MNAKEKTKRYDEFAREMDSRLKSFSTDHLLREVESRLCAECWTTNLHPMLLHRLPIHTYLKEGVKDGGYPTIAGWHVAHDNDCKTFVGCLCTCHPDVTVVPFSV